MGSSPCSDASSTPCSGWSDIWGPASQERAFVGDVLKLFHRMAIRRFTDALVRMAQPFSLRYPLIDGQGNFAASMATHRSDAVHGGAPGCHHRRADGRHRQGDG